MPLSLGGMLGPYEIRSAIGAGGMGEVYRAKDTRLGRDVALKILPADMARDPDRLSRFQREARAVAAINHPNIVTLYSVEQCEGLHFLTMELVEGQSLDRLIPKEGFVFGRIVDMAVALAEALAAAHDQDVIHRDLKPANIMVTPDGRIKVLDFGLAKDIRATGPSDETLTSAGHTQTGMVMGTPPYMSPEQISGRSAGHRSDIFSLGIILYEIASGKRPFAGATQIELAASILRDSPPPIVRTDVPGPLQELITQCLEKEEGRRIQSARALADSLRSIQQTGKSASTGDEGFWVSVLPFKSRTANADLEALAEGLTEEIVTGMSRFSYLRVIAPGAGRDRVARYVMEGNIRQAGARIRVAVQLVDTVTGANLWAESYERNFSAEALFELQDELAPRIVATVADIYGVLPRSMSEAVRNRDPEQLSPYEAVLRSFGYGQRPTADECAAALAGLEPAVRRAPLYGDAWGQLAMLSVQDYGQGFHVRADSLASGTAAARRAVELAPSNHLCFLGLAQALFFQKDLEGFRNAAQRAASLNPMDGGTLALLGELATYAGYSDLGDAWSERAKWLNPHHPGWYWYVDTYKAFRDGDYKAALEYVRRVNLPGHWFGHAAMAAAFAKLGDRESAGRALRELLKIRPDFAGEARAEMRKWWPDERVVEDMLDGWRKAGLAIDGIGEAPEASPVRADEGFWVAVLPIRFLGASVELQALADGLTEEIVTGMSRFSYLRVIAPGAGRDRVARYVMEGNIRQAGARIRVAVQLVDTVTGANLWAESYERSFSAEALFELQDELAPRIVATVADLYGVLPRSMSEAVRNRDPEQLSPYEAVLRSFGYGQRPTADECAASLAGLEPAVRHAPLYGDAWGQMAMLSVQDYAQGFHVLADPLTKGLAAARRSVELAPSNHLCFLGLAQALFFQKDLEGFRNAAERAAALNPMDGCTLALIGELATYAGYSDAGDAWSERAKWLNPHHPGWYWYCDQYKAFRDGDYKASIEYVRRANLPGHWFEHAAMAAAYGKLGEHESAGKALRELLKLRPGFAAEARAEITKGWPDERVVGEFIDGLRKAGLAIDGIGEVPSASAEPSGSAPVRAGDGFWVAVLPIHFLGGSEELQALADGMSEEISAGLSRFSYLRVIASSSTQRYAGHTPDPRTVSKELGARYILSGHLRQIGARMRLAMQLADTSTGVQIWSESYDRTFTADGAFDLQDELVPRIVSTIADPRGVLPAAFSESLRGKSPSELTPYEAVLRSFAYFHRIEPEEHAKVRAALECAVERDPSLADLWAMLSMVYRDEFTEGFNLLPDSLGRAFAAARRAVDAAPSNHYSYHVLAAVLFCRRELQASRGAADRAIALNAMDGFNLAYLGVLIAFSGDWEYGCTITERARNLNPHHPGWYWMAPLFNAYRNGEYREALAFAQKVNLPGYWRLSVALAATYGQLGESSLAAKALSDLLSARPNFAAGAREELEKVWQPDMAEKLLDGLRKAGLDC